MGVLLHFQGQVDDFDDLILGQRADVLNMLGVALILGPVPCGLAAADARLRETMPGRDPPPRLSPLSKTRIYTHLEH
jgi:hypothetical protein